MTVGTLEYVELHQLRFDPKNPRLPLGRSTDREEVLRFLLESANLTDLMRSIATQGFFPGEPLLVTDSGDGTYVVLEGNRRLAACWLLSNPGDAPTRKRSVETIVEDAQVRPTELPCIVLTESEIVGFLGYRHITGIQEWSPLAKARYLLRLWNGDGGPETHQDRLRWIARRIGSRADYVARLLTAFALFGVVESENFFEIPDLDEESLSFSLVALALNRPAVARYIGLESGQDFSLEGLRVKRLRRLTRWFFEVGEDGKTVLGESRNMSRLVAVLEDKEARRALEQGVSLSRAFRMTQTNYLALHEVLSQALDLIDAAVSVATSHPVSQQDRQVLVMLHERFEDLQSVAAGA